MRLNCKGKRRMIASILVMLLIFSGTMMPMDVHAKAAEKKSVSSKYLSTTTKYLYLGDRTGETYDFDITKELQKSGSTYEWYINTKKGDSKAVTINKKSGLVTARKVGKAYIGCKITERNGKTLTPEATVIVRNNITELGISNLPKDNQLSAYSEYTFQGEVLNTQAGKSKATQGLIRWEISEDTASLGKVSETGTVYVAREGSFHIRAIAFESSKEYKLYLSNKVKYESYITAVSKWETITVGAPSASVKVATQEQLEHVLSLESVKDISLVTREPLIFTISKGDYSSKTLVVDAPNSDMNNYGIFKKITVNAIKNSTWIEYSNGNRIYLSDSQLSIVIDNDAEVKEIVFDTPEVNANIVINGKVENIRVLQPVTLNISGSANNTNLSVEESAKGCSLTSSVPIDMSITSDVNIILQKGAEGSSLNRTEEGIKVGVDNQTEKAVKIATRNETEETISAGANTIELVEPTTKPTPTPKVTAKPTPTLKPTPTPTKKPTITVTPTPKPTSTPVPTQGPVIMPPSTPSTGDNSTPPSTDKTAPVYTGMTLSADQRTITLTFDEAIVNNLPNSETLKKQITYTSSNEPGVKELTSGDTVSLNDKKLMITLQNKLYFEDVKLSVAAASLKDSSGNIINNIVTADVTGNDNMPQKATTVTVGAPELSSGLYPATEEDWFCFEAEANQAYLIKASLLDVNVWPKIYLYDADGTTLLARRSTYYDDGETEASIVYGLITGGTYYVKVVNTLISPTTGGSYGISVSETGGMEGEPNNTPLLASTLLVGEKKQGQCIMPKADVDYYKFEANAGEKYYIRASGEEDSMSASLGLYDTDGVNELMLSGNNETMEYTATASGTYYLCVSSKYKDSNQGRYNIELNTLESAATKAVISVENWVKVSPYNSQDMLEIAKQLVAQISNNEVRLAFENRLEAVQEAINAALLNAFNGSNENAMLNNFAIRLNIDSFDGLSTEAQSDVVVLFKYQYPQSMGLRGFTTLEEVKNALEQSCSDYGSLLANVNSAVDTAGMKAALNSLAPIYGLTVTDHSASVILNERGAGYSSVAKVMEVKTTVKVNFSTLFYATEQTYPGYSTSPGGGTLTAEVDGIAIHNGDLIDKGTSVVFNFVPDAGNESFNWVFTGVSASASLATTYTVSNVTKDLSLELRVKKTQIINISAPSTFSKTDTNDLFIPLTYTNTYITGVYGSPEWYINEELLASGTATMVDGGISIKKSYFSALESGKYIHIQVCFSLNVKDLYIMIVD